jgi:hypothetical protein
MDPSLVIDSKMLYEVLRRKGVEQFHHTNTVRISLTFIQGGACCKTIFTFLG